jgi:mannose-6-phosphate isomerase
LSPLDNHLFALEPQSRERVWGGQLLHPATPPIGEVWAAYGPSRIASGAHVGRTLDDLTAEYGAALLGSTVASHFGTHFPLLIKLLDCADWLSVQVHPDDEQARRMVGPDEFGKTEAWYFLSAATGSQIMLGVKPEVGEQELEDAIRGGRIRSVANLVDVQAGDAVVVPAGTLHALGPGLLLYEVQEASDTTYRVYDWDRPASDGRALHIEESVAVTRAVGPVETMSPRLPAGSGAVDAIDTQYFDVDLIGVGPDTKPVAADTRGRSFHILTVIDGEAEIVLGAEQAVLKRFESALVAGSAGEYQTRGIDGAARLLRAAVPDKR